MIVLYCYKAYKDQNYDRIPEANFKIKKKNSDCFVYTDILMFQPLNLYAVL